MKKYNTEAIVLKNKPYKDAGRVYTLLTKDHGKIPAFAGGVRKISSRRSGNLDSLNLVLVGLTENKDGFKHIDEVSAVESFSSLKKSHELMIKGLYMCELIDKAIQNENPDEQIFSLLKKCLFHLNTKKFSPEVVIFYFEINLLKILGYRPHILDKFFDINNLNPKNIKKAEVVVKNIIYEHLAANIRSLSI